MTVRQAAACEHLRHGRLQPFYMVSEGEQLPGVVRQRLAETGLGVVAFQASCNAAKPLSDLVSATRALNDHALGDPAGFPH